MAKAMPQDPPPAYPFSSLLQCQTAWRRRIDPV